MNDSIEYTYQSASDMPIKFRAWDAEAKKMWIPIITTDGKLMIEESLGNFYTFDDPQDSLMQFTGLQDFKGKDIWEGDYVFDIKDKNAPITNYRVRRTELGGWFPFEYNGGGEVDTESCAITGNMYENPELLEKSK